MKKILKNKWFWISLPVILVVLLLSFSDYARRVAFYGGPLLTGVGAKLACSGVYLQDREPDDVIKRDVHTFSPPMMALADYTFDFKQQTATANLFGLIERTALYRPGIGCTLLVETSQEELLAQAKGIIDYKGAHRADEWPLGDVVDLSQADENINWTLLEEGIDAAFEDNTENKTIDTRAVIVVHNGKIIAQRFAEGFDENSRFLSWSASKSVINALIGTLVVDGKLALDEPAPVAEWAGKNDPRHAITLSHLLTMTSGLEFSEPYLPGNDSTDMLFTKAIMGDFAANHPLEVEPGTKWAYSSGTTNLLSRIVFDQSGGSLKSQHDYAWRRFFEPLGMTSAVFEPDGHGSFVGSSFFYATAQDWARFGLLYLNNGASGGKQILSKEWVEYSHTATPLAPLGKYGAQFWLNGGHPDHDSEIPLPDMPKDTYLASGFSDQHIVIVPSRNTVIVRLGWTTGRERFGVNKHFSHILSAIPETLANEVSAAELVVKASDAKLIEE